MQIGVVGSRQLPEQYQEKVNEVVQYLLGRGHIAANGGALGAGKMWRRLAMERGVYQSDLNYFQPVSKKPTNPDVISHEHSPLLGDNSQHHSPPFSGAFPTH